MSYFISDRSKNIKLNYLSKIDLIQKYALKSSYLSPYLSEINLELPLHQLGKFKTKSQKAFTLAKGLSIFFVLFGCLPKIVYNNSKFIKKKRIYSLKFRINKQKDIIAFLNLLNAEQGPNYMSFLGAKFFKNKLNTEKFASTNTYRLISKKLNLETFSQINDLFFQKNWELETGKNFNISFVFNKKIRLFVPNSMVQNIYPFWKANSLY